MPCSTSVFRVRLPNALDRRDDRVRLYPSDQQLTLYTLNARSLNNKPADFVDSVCDIRADLFTIWETWLKDNILGPVVRSPIKLILG